MFPRSLRLLLDGAAGDPGGVKLSAFRARDPEPGWDSPSAELVSVAAAERDPRAGGWRVGTLSKWRPQAAAVFG